jgi:Mannosylglycerate hydrolase MGH1-like glycoside hydrolase domain
MSDSKRLRAMTDAVRALYDRNRQRGVAPWCGLEYDFVCPSMGTYPFQWFWDSCFHAVALSHVDPGRAQIEIRSLLANAQPDGFVAHVTFWQRERFEDLLSTYAIAYRTPYLSDCMQPPVLAEAVAAASRGPGAGAFLADVLPRVRRYYDWLDSVRDPDRDGLIATLQPDESGLDHTPKYDRYLGVTVPDLAGMTAAWERVAGPYATVNREPTAMFSMDRFVVEDVFVNTIYAENQRVLSGLLARIGDHDGAAELAARAARTTRGLVSKCYDPSAGLFFDLAGLREEPLRVNTVSSLVPILLEDIPPAAVEALIHHLTDRSEYGAPFPVPSVAMNEPSYLPPTADSKLVWRGPTWMNSNWYIARGLRRHGHTELARTIEDRSAQLVERSGFREYYDPITGEGFGASDFSWTALVLDLLVTLAGDRP